MSIEQIEIRIQATEKIEFDLQRYTTHRFPKIYCDTCNELYRETWLYSRNILRDINDFIFLPKFFPNSAL